MMDMGKLGLAKKLCQAHRVSYEMYVGPIPAGMLIRHNCDNRKCVNPDHLLPGTCKDNTQDMLARNRQPDMRGKHVGEESGTSKLTQRTMGYGKAKLAD
jgi:hypothetical protein